MLRYVTLIVVLLSALAGCWFEAPQPSAALGVLDLSSWDFENDGITHLNGEWEFFWARLLTPEDFKTAKAPAMTGYFSFPGYWNGHEVNGRRLAGEGYATFRLKIKLRPGGEPLSLRIEDESSAYRLWVNGALLMQDGIVAQTPKAMRPGRTITMAALPSGVENLDCVLQVSNYYLYKGGPYRSISLGTSDSISKRHRILYAADLIIMGILFPFGIYHLFLFALRRNDRPLLYFGLFCLSWCLGIPFGSLSGRFMTLLFPETPWYVLSHMELITWYCATPLTVMFFSSLYPEDFSRTVTRFAQAVGSACVAFVVLAPSRLVNITEDFYSVFSAGLALYVLVRLTYAIRRRRNEAWVMIVGCILFVLATVNDILFMGGIINTAYLTTVGATVLALFQSFAMARRYARAFVTVENLSEELERKNVALTRLDQLKDEFLANTSHELRTPLNGIIGIADSLRSGIAGSLPEKARENLSMIVASGKRLAGLINDILDLTRLRNHDIRLSVRPVDMRALTATVLTVMQPLADGKGLSLINDIPEDIIPVQGDENRLQQILYNLVGNAVKFTDAGDIRVSAAGQGAWVEVAVTDAGIGVPEDKQASIFESFEQADTSDARSYGGAGLGLSITRQLVELHGGTITVTSAPGQGSTFRFSLPACPDKAGEILMPALPGALDPVADQPVPTAADAPLAELPDIDAQTTILAVDDDSINLRVVANYLTFANLTVVTASSGRQAIGLIEQGLQPDLVLLDIMMPQMTGYELLQWLRQRYTASEVPAIMLTAKSGTDDLVMGFAQGANDYLVKPFAREELLARVVAQLKLARSYVKLRENLALHQEVEERRQVEHDLRVMQQNLSWMLDAVDEALFAVDETREITFCNRGCEALLGYDHQSLLGQPIAHLLWQPQDAPTNTDPLHDFLRGCTEGGSRDAGIRAFRRPDGSRLEAHVFVSPLNTEEAPVCLLILRPQDSPEQDSQAAAGQQPAPVEQSLVLIEAINRNRERVHAIRTSLDALLPLADGKPEELSRELDAMDQTLNQISQTMQEGEVYETRSHLAVETMCCALDCWTEATGLTKSDLARQSRLWKVYTNPDGWERTQTLDRYLQVETMPSRPNWAKVMNTAKFVLAACTDTSLRRSRLEMLLARLRVGGNNRVPTGRPSGVENNAPSEPRRENDNIL